MCLYLKGAGLGAIAILSQCEGANKHHRCVEELWNEQIPAQEARVSSFPLW